MIKFVVKGMGISTVTAGRIRKGQLKGILKVLIRILKGIKVFNFLKGNNGEEEITYMQSLPHLALSKVKK